MVQVATPSQPTSIFKSGEKAFAMPVPPPPCWPRAADLVPCDALTCGGGAAESGSANLGPRKVQAAAAHEPWCPALQTAQACQCRGVLTRLALPKHKAELESQNRIFILQKT